MFHFQSRVRECLVNLLNTTGQKVGLPKSPSVRNLKMFENHSIFLDFFYFIEMLKPLLIVEQNGNLAKMLLLLFKLKSSPSIV